MKDTIVILGNADSRSQYDTARSDADVFVFNEAANTAFKGQRIDGVFQLHIPVIWRNPNNRNDAGHYEWLQNTTIPVLMQEQYDDVPASMRFPREDILKIIQNAETPDGYIREVSCSPAWAIAYAIHKGYKRIEIYGVELASNTEYAYQQGNFKFWLGVAIGRGVQVYIASSMFNNPQYGYEGEVEIPYQNFTERINELTSVRVKAKVNYDRAVSAMADAMGVFMNGDNSAEIMKCAEAVINAGQDLGSIEGVTQVNEYYQQKADAMLKTSEQFVFSRQEFEHNARQAQNNAAKIQARYNGYGGQLSLLHQAVVRAAKGSPKRKKQLDNYRNVFTEYVRASNELAGWLAAAQENTRYMARLDAGIKAAGGAKSEEVILGNG